MYKLAFFFISAIISDAILGSNPNATEAEIERVQQVDAQLARPEWWKKTLAQ